MRRWLILAATLWPIVYMAFFFVVVGIASIAGDGDPDDDFPVPFGVILALHLLTMLIIVVLLVVYVVDVFRNPRVPQDQRVMWLIVILLGGPIAMPIYWWLHMRPTPAAAP